jgi:hypothetical protein
MRWRVTEVMATASVLELAHAPVSATSSAATSSRTCTNDAAMTTATGILAARR